MENSIILALGVAAIGLWLWAIIDITLTRRSNPIAATIWFWILIIFPILGPLFYFQFKKKLFFSGPKKFNPNFSHH